MHHFKHDYPSTPEMSSKSPIDLSQGSPAPSLLPIQRLKEAAITILSNPSIANQALDYGPDAGYYPLRENIAQWLTGFYTPSQAIPAERICITGGASQNLACALQVFTDPNQTRAIWMVEPTYHLVFQAFRDAGFEGRMKAVPDDGEGMNVDVLKERMEKMDEEYSSMGVNEGCPTRPPGSDNKHYKHVIYCVPNFANPTATTMTLARREALVRLARKHDALIITDDVYDFLQLPSRVSGEVPSILPRIVDIDRTIDGGPIDDFGNAMSNGTFSKLIGPGCRAGWAEGTERFVHGLSRCGSNISGGAPSQLTSTYVNELFEDGYLERHISDVIVPACARRYLSTASAMKEHLSPLGVSFNPDPETDVPEGGFFIWLTLPRPLSAKVVCEKALREENLKLGNGWLFAVPGSTESKERVELNLRICYMCSKEELLVEGIQRLGAVLRALLDR